MVLQAILATLLCSSPLAAQSPPDEAADLAAFVHGALAAAPSNFSGLRGARLDEDRFASTANFGPSFAGCWVVDDSAAAIFAGATGAWDLECDSIPQNLSQTNLTDLVRKSVTASLPPAFALRTYADPARPDRIGLEWSGPGGVQLIATFESDATGKTSYHVLAERVVGSPRPTDGLRQPMDNH